MLNFNLKYPAATGYFQHFGYTGIADIIFGNPVQRVPVNNAVFILSSFVACNYLEAIRFLENKRTTRVYGGSIKSGQAALDGCFSQLIGASYLLCLSV